MAPDRQTLRSYLVSFVLILASGIVFHNFTNPYHLPKSSLIFLLFLTVGFRWITRARRSFPQRATRRNATFFGCAMIWLCLMQCIKYAFSTSGSGVQRYLWYLYYAAILFAPVWMYFAVMHLSRPDDYRIPRAWNLIYIPSAALLAAVLTNDLHRSVFRFTFGVENWNDGYSYGPVYYAAVAWIVLLVAATLAALLKNCINRRLFRNLWMPALVLLFAATYWMGFLRGENETHALLQRFFALPTFIGYCSFAFWESLRVARILPSNNGYEDFFKASSLHAGLADRDFEIKQVSAEGPQPTPDLLRRAAALESLPLPDGDTVLKTRKVRGGWFYWIEDVGALRGLNEALEDTAGYLAEENALLHEKAQKEEGRRRTAHQTELYNAIAKRLHSQIAALDLLLESAPEEETAFREQMKRAALIFTFLKRCANLHLLADEQPTLRGADLRQCLEQSALWLRELGVECEFGEMPEFLQNAAAAAVYELFETLAELPTLRQLSLGLRKTDENLLLTLRFSPGDLPEATRACAEALGDARFSRAGADGALTVAVREGAGAK